MGLKPTDYNLMLTELQLKTVDRLSEHTAPSGGHTSKLHQTAEEEATKRRKKENHSIDY